MKSVRIALVVGLLVLVIHMPCGAENGMVLTTDETEASTLKVGTFAIVTYYFHRKMSPVRTVKIKRSARGFISSVEEDGFALKFGQTTIRIKYADVLTMATGAHEEDIEDSKLVAAVHEGARVRVRAPSVDKQRLTGTVMRLHRDTLVVQARSSGQLSIPMMSIERLEVIQGKKHHFMKGAAIGFFVGMLALLPAASIAEEEAGANSAPIMIGGGLSGALAGGLLGVAIRTPKWEKVPLDRMRMGLAPRQNGGVVLRAALKF